MPTSSSKFVFVFVMYYLLAYGIKSQYAAIAVVLLKAVLKPLQRNRSEFTDYKLKDPAFVLSHLQKEDLKNLKFVANRPNLQLRETPFSFLGNSLVILIKYVIFVGLETRPQLMRCGMHKTVTILCMSINNIGKT